MSQKCLDKHSVIRAVFGNFIAMVRDITDHLRTLSQRCARAARECSDGDLSRALEELAIDLAMKAADLDQRFDC